MDSRYPGLRSVAILCLSVFLCPILAQGPAAKKVDDPATAASIPSVSPKDRLSESWWADRHKSIVASLPNHADAQLLLLGDSITQNYEKSIPPSENFQPIWQQYYAPRKALNLGFSGDTTANVLWRIEHGEVDNIQPSVAVILIGTNNNGAGRTTPAPRTAAAIERIAKELHQKQPQMKILIVGILPKQTSPEKLAIDHAVNVMVAHDLGKDPLVTCVDVGPIFYNQDGTLNMDLYMDQKNHPDHPALHPTAIGLRMEAQAIEPILAKLLGDKPKQWP